MPPRVLYNSNEARNERLVTTGTCRNTRRQIAIYDSVELEKPLTVLSNEAPFISYLNESSGHKAHTAVCALPKRGLSVSQCEIMRIFRVDATQLVIEPLSFIVPRREQNKRCGHQTSDKGGTKAPIGEDNANESPPTASDEVAIMNRKNSSIQNLSASPTHIVDDHLLAVGKTATNGRASPLTNCGTVASTASESRNDRSPAQLVESGNTICVPPRHKTTRSIRSHAKSTGARQRNDDNTRC
uniref:Uncharacterized protein n=1 Tax=Parascaris equorum TaxID=6256 RepID=A0A914RZD0_PAREQ